MKRYTVTAALPYTNGPVHIGHLAGVYVPADIFARYLRAKDEDVVFICGSDEHGVPITLRARNEGITPQQLVDKYHGIIKKSFEDFGVSFDIYHRTSDKLHHQTASDFFKTLYDKNIFVEEESEQYFDEEAKMFLADRYITGTCPNCANPNAYGDQCERCGKSLTPRDLINPHSQLSGKPPVLKKTKHWYLPLDTMQKEWLQDWILSKKEIWKSNVFGQCKSWIDQGLQPRAVTRDLDWGVPVPLKDAEGKVLYVWFDAPIGYISATKALFNNKEEWKKYWCDKDTRLIHFIGKDNIVFHCIIFPAMLKAHGEFILPENVPANEFLNLEGDKISTSRNWAVWLNEYLEEFPHKQDVLRYVLCATAPETKDNDFTWKDFQARNNSELVAILGNFVNRTLVLSQKYYEGKVPQHGQPTAGDNAVIKEMKEVPARIGKCIEEYRFRDAQFELMNLARTGNKYLAENEPWKTIKTDEARTATILYISLEISASLAYLMEPFLPFTSVKLLKMLNLEKKKWNEVFGKQIFKVGHQLGEASLLFEKIEDDVIEKQIQKLHSTKPVATPAPNPEQTKTLKPMVSIDDFQKLDIRVGKIILVEDFPEARKPMYKLKIDFGSEIGIKNSSAQLVHTYKKEDLLGKIILGVVNFPPRKVGPFTSEVLTLGVPDKNGNSILVEPGIGAEIGGQLY